MFPSDEISAVVKSLYPTLRSIREKSLLFTSQIATGLRKLTYKTVASDAGISALIRNIQLARVFIPARGKRQAYEDN